LTASLVDVVSEAIESRLADVFTAAIGVVHKYDASTKTAEIQLTTKRPIRDEVGGLAFQEFPILQDVRICFPQAGGYSITFPISPGDGMLVVFTQLDPSKWLATGEAPSLPQSVRQHALSNAFAIPLVAPRNATLTGATESAMVIAGDEIRLGAATAAEVDNVALATATKQDNQTLFNEIQSATIVPNDGGASFQTTLVAALALAGYPHDVGSPTVKAKK